MTHTYTLKQNRHKYRYYLCTNAQKRGYAECPHRYVSAQAAEDEVVKLLRRLFQDKIIQKHKTECEALLSPIWDTLFFEEERRIIQTLLKEINCDAQHQKLGLLLTGSAEWQTFDVNMKTQNARMRNRKERQITSEPSIRKVLILSHHIDRLMATGEIKNPKQASDWLGLSQSRLNHILGLLLISPLIQTEIMTADEQSLAHIPEYKIRNLSAEVDWEKQVQLWLKIKKPLLKS